jgi:hypothetical protein
MMLSWERFPRGQARSGAIIRHPFSQELLFSV